MPDYTALKREEDGPRAAERLLALRRQLRKEIPRKTVRDTLLLATWNIRDFDSNKFGHGFRLPESFHYIAEIISAFDLVAVQEVNRNLSALKRVMRLLGRGWSYIVTDTTVGSSGNQERMAFVYDRRKVTFQHIAGEIVLPRGKKIGGKIILPEDCTTSADIVIPRGKKLKEEIVLPKGTVIEAERQFARTPYQVSFQSRWFKFSLCTVHIYYGAASGKKLTRRIAEIDSIAAFLADRAHKQPDNFILLGDFNIVHPEHKTMKALTRHGFKIPVPLQDITTNISQEEYYDQIAFMTRPNELQLGDSESNAGAFYPYKSVFRPQDYDTYYKYMVPKLRDIDKKGHRRNAAGKREYYANEWRTFQISDHLPLWVELKIDFADRYLSGI